MHNRSLTQTPVANIYVFHDKSCCFRGSKLSLFAHHIFRALLRSKRCNSYPSEIFHTTTQRARKVTVLFALLLLLPFCDPLPPTIYKPNSNANSTEVRVMSLFQSSRITYAHRNPDATPAIPNNIRDTSYPCVNCIPAATANQPHNRMHLQHVQFPTHSQNSPPSSLLLPAARHAKPIRNYPSTLSCTHRLRLTLHGQVVLNSYNQRKHPLAFLAILALYTTRISLYSSCIYLIALCVCL
jgi:hypothetical protein